MNSLLNQVSKAVDDVVVKGPKLDKTVTNGKAAMTPVKWNCFKNE